MAKRLTQKEKHSRKCEYEERQNGIYEKMCREEPNKKASENFRRKPYTKASDD